MNNAIDIFVKHYGATPGDQYQEWLTRKIQNKPMHPTFPFQIQRDFCDTETELAVEVIELWPASVEGNGERLGAVIEIGKAYTLDGKEFELTELERERAYEEACRR